MLAHAPHPPGWPIVIAGGGIPSLALALALRQGCGEAVEVTIAEPGRPRGTGRRAYALSPASVGMLDTLGLWASLRSGAEPVTGMRITDSRLGDAIRPDYLRFGSGREDALGFLLEDAPIEAALQAACRDVGIRFVDAAVEAPLPGPSGIAVDLGGVTQRACLLVAGDGARSRLREAFGIGWIGRRYPQMALVATIGHEHDHGGLAVQHFLPAGPFAILPLAGPGATLPHRSSIVWTEDEGIARRLLRGEIEVASSLDARFGPELGRIALDGRLGGFPLGIGLARSFVADRAALIGDAAHEIHPLAGQGLNLGLADAASLAEHVTDSVRLGLDPGRREVLAAYQQDRRFDAVLLATLTDGLNRLFSTDSLTARVLRDLGLGLVDRAPGLKGWLAGEAAGQTRRAPRLMRGEAL